MGTAAIPATPSSIWQVRADNAAAEQCMHAQGTLQVLLQSFSGKPHFNETA